MATSSVQTLGRDGLHPTRRERRNSYFEMLSSISSDLNFVASDLRKAQVQFKASAPKSPLAVSASIPTVTNSQDQRLLHLQTVDRYQQLRVSRNYSVGTNNNASTVSTSPAIQYNQPSSTVMTRDPICTSALYDKSVQSLVLPSSPVPQSTPVQGTFTNPHHHPGLHGDDSMELSLLTRLVHTKPVWFLPHTPRAAAIHYLQGQPVGTFVVCQSRDKDNLVLTMKHPGTGTGLYIEKLPIHISPNGVKLMNASEEFSTIEDLILHHLHHEGALPCKLNLPSDIMAAGNIRALQSLALLEEVFWTRNQLRQGPSGKQGEGRKDDTKKSPMDWPTTLPSSTEPQKHSPPIPSIFTPTLAPRFPTPKGYIVMSKQPIQPTIQVAGKIQPESCENLTQGMSQVSLRNNKVVKNIADNRQLLKSWSFDDKSNPFRQSEFLSMNLNAQSESTDDTLLASSGRQPMRISTQSQQEYVLKNLSHYPPPLHSPPPPPKEVTCHSSPLESFITPPIGYRSSAEYYTPFETTRQNHQPPSVFGFESLLSSSVPPPLPSKGPLKSALRTQYQQPNPGISPGEQASQYSTPSMMPNPVATLASLQQSSFTQTTQVQSYQSVVASSEGQSNLTSILQPSMSVAPSPADDDPLLEFDPLLTTKPRCLPSPPPSQDVFSTAPSQPAPSIPTHRHSLNVGNLLNLSSDGSEEEELTGFQLKDTIETTCSSEDWDQSCDDEEEEYEERNVIDEKKYSPLRDEQSDDTFYQTRDTQEEDISKSDHNESTVDKLSELSTSQTKKMKKLKKKKMSSLSRIQKYVLRGKSKKKKSGDPREEIQAAIHKLASNKSSYFSMMMECFVQNIKDRDEQERPDILIRNLRQFMSGMKNYLFNRREPEVDAAMDKYYNLTMAELDAIVEGAIYNYILLPLKPEIYKCFIIDHKESGALDVLDHNIQLARAKTPAELGIKPNYIPPEGEDLARIRQYFHQLMKTYSPIKKLEYLLDIVRTVYDTVVDQNSSRGQAVQSMGADDFLPMFIYVLVQCEVVDIEIEANYMWGLLEPSMLSGEGGYYLTTLSSAICVLKQFEQETQNTETKGFLSVMVAMDDSVVHKTLPVLPGMNAGDVSRILAHKLRIDNAHQYQLYLLSGDQETPIGDNECPLELKEKSGQQRACFGYKKEDHHVQWTVS